MSPRAPRGGTILGIDVHQGGDANMLVIESHGLASKPMPDGGDSEAARRANALAAGARTLAKTAIARKRNHAAA